MRYRKKPVVIEAITFDELVAHGVAQNAAAGNPLLPGSLPWSFTYGGHPITHENDDCYLIPTLEGTMKMGRNDMLITGVQGEIYPCKVDIFHATYDAMILTEADSLADLNGAPRPDHPTYQGASA